MFGKPKLQYEITALDRSQAGIQSAQRAIGGLTGAGARAISTFAALTSVLSTGAFTAFVKSGINAGDQLNKLSQQLSVSAEDLSTLRFAATQNNLEFGKLTTGLSFFQRALGKSGQDVKDIIPAFKEAADRIIAIKSPTLQAAEAFRLFGRQGGKEFLEFLRLGGQGITELQGKARDLGLEISGETAKAQDEFNDKLATFGQQIEAVKIAFAGGFIDGLKDFKGTIVDPEFIGSIENLGRSFANFFQLLSDHKRTVLAITGALIGLRGGVAGAVIGGAAGFGLGSADFSDDTIKELQAKVTALKQQEKNVVGGKEGFFANLFGGDSIEKVREIRSEIEATEKTIGELQATAKKAPIFDTAAAKVDFDAFGKAQKAVADKSISESKRVTSEYAKSAAERVKNEKEIRRLQQEAFDDRLEEIHEEGQVWRDLEIKVKAGIEERATLEKDQADARADVLREHAEENRRLFEQPFLNAIDGIQGSFTDAFVSIFNGGVDSFSDLADTVKQIFIRLAAEIASLLVFRAALSGVAGLFGGGGGVGGAAASLLGGGGGSGSASGGLLDLLSTGSSGSSAVGGPSLLAGLTSSINTFGGSLGFGAGTATIGSPLTGGVTSASAGSLTSATLSSVLGSAGLGAGIGGLLAGSLGGNTTVGTIAGGVGGIGGGLAGGALAASAAAAATSAFGAAAGAAAFSVVPVIGTIIGAILGGLIGGAIKETPPRGFQISSVGGGVIEQGGKKGFDPTSLSPISGGISGAILQVGSELGIDKDRLKAIEFWIGYNDESGYRTTVTGKGDLDFGKTAKDVEKLQTTIFEQELKSFAGRKDKFVRKVLNEAFDEKSLIGAVNTVHAYVVLKQEIEKAAGTDAEGLRFGGRVLTRALRSGSVRGAAASADKDIAFRKQFEMIDNEAQDQLKLELKALQREFNSLRNKAQSLGLSVTDLNKVEKDRTRAFIASRLGIDPNQIGGSARSRLRDELESLHDAFVLLRKHARDLGVSLGEVNKLEKDRTVGILSDRLTGAIGGIQSLQQQTGIAGIQQFLAQQKTSDVLAPKDRLAAAKDQFKDLLTAAKRGDFGSAQALPGAGQELLALGREVDASGPRFAALRDLVIRSLTNFQERQERIFKFPDLTSTLRDVGKQQVAAIKDQTAKLSEEIVLLRRELRRALAA